MTPEVLPGSFAFPRGRSGTQVSPLFGHLFVPGGWTQQNTTRVGPHVTRTGDTTEGGCSSTLVSIVRSRSVRGCEPGVERSTSRTPQTTTVTSSVLVHLLPTGSLGPLRWRALPERNIGTYKGKTERPPPPRVHWRSTDRHSPQWTCKTPRYRPRLLSRYASLRLCK